MKTNSEEQANIEVPCEYAIEQFLERAFLRAVQTLLAARSDHVTVTDSVIKRLVERAWEIAVEEANVFATCSVPETDRIRQRAVDARRRLHEALE